MHDQDLTVPLCMAADQGKTAIAITDIDTEGCPIVHANRRFCRLHGRASDEIVGQSLLALYADAHRPALLDARGAATLGRSGTVHAARLPDAPAPGLEEHIVLGSLAVPGCARWLISCHMTVDLRRWQEHGALARRTAHLKACNALRLLSCHAMVAWLQAGAAVASGPRRADDACAAPAYLGTQSNAGAAGRAAFFAGAIALSA